MNSSRPRNRETPYEGPYARGRLAINRPFNRLIW
jgi:hypothetical protein